MSLRSVLKAALAGVSKALRAAGRAARAAAAPAIMVTEAVVDAATGAIRFVSRLVNPAPAVSAAEAQADAYLDAAASEPEASAPEPAPLSMAERFPEADYLRNWCRHAIGSPGVGPVDESVLPDRILLWLHSLDVGNLHRVAVAPLSTLDRHLRAKSVNELMTNMPPVLTDREARAAAEARRDAVIASLARASCAERAAESVDEFLDDLHEHAVSEAGPAPLPFR
ncbi:hypothetical protein ACLBXO_16350 [Methylobacterium sp. C33D]